MARGSVGRASQYVRLSAVGRAPIYSRPGAAIVPHREARRPTPGYMVRTIDMLGVRHECARRSSESDRPWIHHDCKVRSLHGTDALFERSRACWIGGLRRRRSRLRKDSPPSNRLPMCSRDLPSIEFSTLAIECQRAGTKSGGSFPGGGGYCGGAGRRVRVHTPGSRL